MPKGHYVVEERILKLKSFDYFCDEPSHEILTSTVSLQIFWAEEFKSACWFPIST